MNRLLDGLDGALARCSAASDMGGFLDIVADFSIYGGFLVALAFAVPGARVALVVLIFAYYVSGTALLALSSIEERRAVTDSTIALSVFEAVWQREQRQCWSIARSVCFPASVFLSCGSSPWRSLSLPLNGS